ncbi:hypothetical protein ABK040_013890 [Willaertia magna]
MSSSMEAGNTTTTDNQTITSDEQFNVWGNQEESTMQDETNNTSSTDNNNDFKPAKSGKVTRGKKHLGQKKTPYDRKDKKETDPKSNFVGIRVPGNRYTALKTEWEQIYTPIVEKLQLQIRMNTKQNKVEIRVPPNKETDPEAIKNLTKARDFVTAFMIGFTVEDSLALLRLDDIYVESFDAKDVKRSLQGDHLSRAIARIAGKGGAVKFTIENATKTRVVIADARIHIMGSFANIQLARSAIVDLILGSPPGVVYNKLRIVSARLKEQF